MDFSECACSGKTLARLLQPAIMTVLARQPVHGYLILQRLQDLPMFRDHPPDATGVYRFLKSMEKDGLVTSTWDLADTGPARRRFVLTHDGEVCLGHWVETLEEYRRTVTQLLAELKAAR